MKELEEVVEDLSTHRETEIGEGTGEGISTTTPADAGTRVMDRSVLRIHDAILIIS